MNTAWLVITFILAETGEPVLVDGWMPREYPSYEVCLERLAFFENYEKYGGIKLPETFSSINAYCGEFPE